MLLSSVLFVLFLDGCWLYCLADAALTPATEYRGLSKITWLCIIIATFIVGAVAWLIARRSWRNKSWAAAQVSRATSPNPAAPRQVNRTSADAAGPAGPGHPADAAVARHPAGRARQTARGEQAGPKGPDDDPEFLRLLDRRIHGTSDPGE